MIVGVARVAVLPILLALASASAGASGARPPVALTASPAHLELAGDGSGDGTRNELRHESRRSRRPASRVRARSSRSPEDRRPARRSPHGSRLARLPTANAVAEAGCDRLGHDRFDGPGAGRAGRPRCSRPLHHATPSDGWSRGSGANGGGRRGACAWHRRASSLVTGAPCDSERPSQSSRARRRESGKRHRVRWPCTCNGLSLPGWTASCPARRRASRLPSRDEGPRAVPLPRSCARPRHSSNRARARLGRTRLQEGVSSAAIARPDARNDKRPAIAGRLLSFG